MLMSTEAVIILLILFTFIHIIIPVCSYFVTHWFTLKWFLPTKFAKLKKPLFLFDILCILASPIAFFGIFFLIVIYQVKIEYFSRMLFPGFLSQDLYWEFILELNEFQPMFYLTIMLIAIAQVIFLIFYAQRIEISRREMITPALVASIIGCLVTYIYIVLVRIALFPIFGVGY